MDINYYDIFMFLPCRMMLIKVVEGNKVESCRWSLGNVPSVLQRAREGLF